MNITTDRLHIRPIRAEDWSAVRAIWVDFSASPYARYDTPHNTDPADVRARIARWAAFTSAGMEHMFFAVCLGEAVIGYVAFNIRQNGYETGYCFHSAHHGKGYAKEAFRALLSHMKGLGVTRICAGTALNNTPSVKLLTSLGFRLTGTEQVSFYKDAKGKDIVFEGGIFELDMQ